MYKTKYSDRVKDFDELISVSASISKSTLAALRLRSKELNLPVSKLIGISIDNELECQPSFNYPCELPEHYVEGEYSVQSKMLFNYLVKFPLGAGLDTIVMCRRDAGLTDKKDVFGGMKELVEKNLVEVYYPANSHFKYPLEYRYYRIAKDLVKNYKEQRRRDFETMKDEIPIK